jgi:hypothetical protein
MDCPTARILSFGYNADFAKFFPDDTKHIAPELTIDDYSTSLLEALKVVRGNADSVSYCPLGRETEPITGSY